MKLRHLGYFLASLVAIIFVALWLVLTNSGLQTTVYIINKVYNDTVHITNAKGKLINNVYITKIIFTTEKERITLLNTKLKCYPLNVFLNRFEIKNLNIENITIDKSEQINTSNQISKEKNNLESFDFKNIKLPIIINAEKVHINTLAINNYFAKPIYINNITISAKNSFSGINIRSITAWCGINKLLAQGKINFRALSANIKVNIINTAYKNNNKIVDLKISGSLKNNIDLNIITYNFYTQGIDNQKNGFLNLNMKNAINYGKIIVDGAWNGASIPLANNKNIYLKKGEIKINGDLKNYNLKLTALFNTINFNNVNLNLTGTGSTKALFLNSVNITWPTTKTQNVASIFGFANINWLPYTIFQTNLQFHNVDFGIITSELSSNLNMGLAIEFDSSKNLFSLHVNNLYGALNTKNIYGHIAYFFENNASKTDIDLESKTINNDHIKILAAQNNSLEAKWDIKINNLKDYLHSTSGTINSSGYIKSDNSVPLNNLNQLILKTDTQINNFLLGNDKIEQFILNSDIDLTKKYYNLFKFSAKNITYKFYKIKNINVNLNGDIAAHNLSANINIFDDIFAINLHGAYANNIYNMNIDKFDLTSIDFKNWQLKNNINIKVKPHFIEILPFCWSSNTGSLCGNLKYENSSWKINLKTQNLPSKLLCKYLTDVFTVSSDINTDANFYYNNKVANGKMKIDISDGKIILPRLRHKEISFLPSQIEIYPIKNNLETTIKINLPNKSYLTTDFKISQSFLNNFNFARARINGFLNAQLNDFNFLQNISYYFNITGGSLSLAAKFSGSLARPNFIGELNVKNTNLNINIINTSINNINLNLKIKNQKVFIKAAANIKEKPIIITGVSNLATKTLDSKLNISANNIPLLDIPNMRINISPNIIINYSKPDLYLTGSTIINSADVDLSSLEPIEILPDSVVILTKDLRKKTGENIFVFYLDHKIILNDKNVKISYLGFNSNLTGTLDIKESPKEYTNATGTINFINGKYSAHGASLSLNSGTFIYVNQDITNPNIDFLATKKVKCIQTQNIGNITDKHTLPSSIQDVTVGVKATGTLQQPNVRLFATPAVLSDSNILSYLILNSPASNLDATKGSLLLQTAKNFSIGGVSILDELQQIFGINEIGIDTEPVIDPTDQEAKQNTYFMVGKQITPHLHASYRTGLIIPDNIFRLSYFIDTHWTLQTETSTFDNSADIFYTIER